MSKYINTSILKKAQEKRLVEFEVINLRSDRHPVVDDYAYGGSSGMVLKIEPIIDALDTHNLMNFHKIILSPSGKTFSQDKARELSLKNKNIVLLCGHYEGFDARIEKYFDEEISIGDYVITSGELSALIISDSIVRLIPGVLNNHSVAIESFDDNLLDFPVYTRPREFRGDRVPDVYLNGNHKEILEYRQKERERITKQKRPDLFKKYLLGKS